MNDRPPASVVIGSISIALLVAFWLFSSRQKPEDHVTVATAAVPVIMHTSGGRLEVATVKAKEAFRLADPKEVLGVDLGTTISHVQVSVVYRYYIEMAKEWPIQIQGTTAVVAAGEMKPSLPISFDTATIEQETTSGWARFNKHENLDKLQKLMSAEMAIRAGGYKNAALDSARKTVTDFVTTWLIKEQNWKSNPEYRVKVVFPGETLSIEKRSNNEKPQP